MRIKIILSIIGIALLAGTSSFSWAQSGSAQHDMEMPDHTKVKPKETSMYADFFDKNIYDRISQWFYLTRAYRILTGTKIPSVNVNVYDEIPDSGFFTNRIGRNDMSLEEIIKGPERTDGPETQGPWLVTKGKVEGLNPGFFIKDATGNEYLLKFDPQGYSEMSSGAESIVSRLFYAFGYNVPQYRVVYFDPAILQAWPEATFYDKDGFKKKLTMDKVKELLENVERLPDGRIRASASLKVPGILKGPMSLSNYRKDDADDYFRHRNHREIRALRVFGSWTNHHDIRKGNTLDAWVQDETGRGYLKHYVIDFGSSLGSAGFRVKDKNLTHEYILDYGSIFARTATLGLIQMDWEKRWEENAERIKFPSVGYMDNLYFDGGKWKPQLPHYAFDDLSLGDAFWAAKIIMKVRPEILRGLMSVADYSDKEAENFLYEALLERQKLIGRYWFSRVTPLDEFVFRSQGGGRVGIEFKDLEVFYDLTPGTASPAYRYQIVTKKSKKKEIIHQGSTPFNGSPLELDLAPFRTLGQFDVLIQKLNPKTGKWNPPVALTLSFDASRDEFILAGIWHRDR